MQRILFVLALVVVTALMTTPPMAAEPLLTPSSPVLDVGDEAVKIAKKAAQTADWLLHDDNDNDADKSQRQAAASQK